MAKDPRAMAALRRFEKAVMTLAFKGAAPPEEHPYIETEYKAAKEQIKRWLPSLSPGGR